MNCVPGAVYILTFQHKLNLVCRKSRYHYVSCVFKLTR